VILMALNGERADRGVRPVLPFSRVLCPTDLSERSREVVRVAAAVAARFAASLVLVHVVQPLPAATPALGFPIGLAALETTRLSEAERRLRELAIAGLPPGLSATVRAVLGSIVANEIVDLARDESADLIVISAYRPRGLRRLLFGSVVERVIRAAPCSVLTVRCSAKSPTQGTDQGAP